MAKKEKEKKSKDYAEFKFKGETFDYTGRVYPAKKKGNPFIYLTINDVITIQCHLVEGKKSSFIGWPSYEVDGKWKSNIFVDEDLNDEMDKLVEVIEKALEDME